jgi:hypothetical protein
MGTQIKNREYGGEKQLRSVLSEEKIRTSEVRKYNSKGINENEEDYEHIVPRKAHVQK